MQVVDVNWNRREVVDPTVYTGLLGTAFTCLRSFEVTGCREDLLLCSEIIDTCVTVARASLRYFFSCIIVTLMRVLIVCELINYILIIHYKIDCSYLPTQFFG